MRKGGRQVLAIAAKPLGNRPSSAFWANEGARLGKKRFAPLAKGRFVKFFPSAKRTGVVVAEGFLHKGT